MSIFTSNMVTREHVLACCALVVLVHGACTLAPATGAEPASIPNFAPNGNVGWIASGKGFGVDFVQPPSGPGPVTNDPAYPYLTNAEAARTGRQPTYRVADLSNPILKPWAVEQMRKANAEVIAGKIPVHGGLALLPGGRSELSSLPGKSRALHPDTDAGADDLAAGRPDPTRLFEPAAFGRSEAVLVRRIGRPLRGRRYARRRYHRARTTRPSSTITARRTPPSCT